MIIKFKNNVIVKNIDESGLYFSDGSRLEDNHWQDCCENVFADWENLKDSGINDHKFDYLSIEKVEGSGFNILLFEYPSVRFFVPCYNSQNGYYSANLSLEYTSGDVQVSIDISSAVKDDIC